MSENIRCNVGCGKKQREGEVGIDHKDYGQKYVLDMDNDKLPFADNNVDYLRADHFLEHLRDCQNMLNEAWRVLKFDGKFEIYVPHADFKAAFSPVHKQLMNEYWFQWLEKDDCWELYDYRRWQILELTIAQKEDGTKYEIHCIMQPRKI